MNGRAERRLQVVEKKYLTPNMIRIVLSGGELLTFPKNMAGGYVKLYFPADEAYIEKPIMRSYTVRHFDAEQLRLTLDFATHGYTQEDTALEHHSLGPASLWALNVNVGDYIMTNGPGAVKLVDTSADWFFLVGDMTALPALGVNIETLPRNAKGYLVVEVMDEADQQNLNVPEGIQVEWVVNPHPAQSNTILQQAVNEKPWLTGRPSVWLAGEFDTMRTLRHYFKKNQGVAKDQIYASSYWKIGDTDEGNKAAKRLDIEN